MPLAVALGAMPVAAQQQAASIVLPRDTPVQLMVMTEVSTRDRHPGDRFRLAVNAPVTLGGRTLIPVGTLAWGEVIAVRSSGAVGRSGSLHVRLVAIDLKGISIPLSAEREMHGGQATGQTVVAVIGFGLPGLFSRGNNARLKAGEVITAFTSADVTLPAPTGA